MYFQYNELGGGGLGVANILLSAPRPGCCEAGCGVKTQRLGRGVCTCTGTSDSGSVVEPEDGCCKGVPVGPGRVVEMPHSRPQ